MLIQYTADIVLFCLKQWQLFSHVANLVNQMYKDIIN